MKSKVLIIDVVHDILYESLNKYNISFDSKLALSKEELIKIIENYTAIILRGSMQLTREIIQEGKNLKIIARPGSGLDNIDVKFAQSKGINCVNSPEGNANSVGEYCVGMLLALCNQFKIAHQNFDKKIWDRFACKGISLKGKTVALLGYGSMGKSFAQKLASFSVKVLAYDKYLKNYTDDFVIESDLKTIHTEADIVSLHIPLNKETKYLANIQFFNSFSKPIIFLNTSRGKIVNTKDLLYAVNKHKVLFAGLDVLEFEKFLDIEKTEWHQELFSHPRIQITPHIAGLSEESEYLIAQILFEKIMNLNIL